MLRESNVLSYRLGDLVAGLEAAGLDVHVIVLAALGDLFNAGICVEPPLGTAGACTVPRHDDSNLPRYFHHPTAVIGNDDALKVVVDTFAEWKDHLRARSLKVLLGASDADATAAPYTTAASFIAAFPALDARLPGRWRASALFSYSLCTGADAIGEHWRDLVQATGGAEGDACSSTLLPGLQDIEDNTIAALAGCGP